MKDQRSFSASGPLSAGHRASSGPFRAVFASSGHTSPFVISVAARRSRWYRWRCPQIIDQPHDFLKQAPWDRHLGQLEGDIPAMADDLGPDLDQLLP